MKLHIIMHESFEAPGAIELWARNKNHEVKFTRLYLGESFPENINNIDFLIIMGGPQCPETTLEECPHFNAKKEIEFIRSVINENKIVLGVCLGAQLIGEALGAKFEHSPNREIGVFELMLTAAGKKDTIFSSFPEKFLVGHWHGDMPGLTKDCEILAYSKGCPRQIVKYTPRIYGFQCHFEFTLESIEGMILNCKSELEKYKSLPYIESISELKSHDYSKMNNYLFIFLNSMEKLHINEKIHS